MKLARHRKQTKRWTAPKVLTETEAPKIASNGWSADEGYTAVLHIGNFEDEFGYTLRLTIDELPTVIGQLQRALVSLNELKAKREKEQVKRDCPKRHKRDGKPCEVCGGTTLKIIRNTRS